MSKRPPRYRLPDSRGYNVPQYREKVKSVITRVCQEDDHDTCKGQRCNCGCHKWDHAYEMDGPIDQD